MRGHSRFSNPGIAVMTTQTGLVDIPVTPGDPFGNTVRAVSDYGKSKAQIDAEYQQELYRVYGSFLGPGKDTRVFDIWLSQIRRYYTHEQIMSGNFQMPEGKVLTFKETLGPLFHAIAGVVAYVPGFGTAVAYVLNTATSLAEGAPITEAALDAVKGALPGQPASTMAFDAAVAIARGEPIASVGIDALPVDDSVKDYIKTGASVVQELASGKPIAAVALTEIYNQLPPAGQQAMDVAKKVANGEDVGNIALQEAGSYLKDATQQQVNEFIANVGYQQLMLGVPDDIRKAVDAANALAYAMQAQQGAPIGHYFVTLGRVETAKDKIRNDALAAKGQAIASGNFVVKTRRERKSFLPQAVTNDVWRRGFDIGTAAAYGLTANTSALNAVQSSLGNITAMRGFAAGRDLQLKLANAMQSISAQKAGGRTVLQQINLENAFENATDEERLKMAVALGRVRMTTDPYRMRTDAYAKTGALLAQSNPTIAAARSLNPDPDYRYGFDVGTAISQLTTIQHDPPIDDAEREHASVRASLSPLQGIVSTANGIKGFDVGAALMFGINKMRADNSTVPPDPNAAAGAAVATGLAGSPTSADHKASVIQTVSANPDAKAGAAQVIAAKTGFFHKLAVFFGLASP
jgi:hypothetical protein